jgi:hypothetical protein
MEQAAPRQDQGKDPIRFSEAILASTARRTDGVLVSSGSSLPWNAFCFACPFRIYPLFEIEAMAGLRVPVNMRDVDQSAPRAALNSPFALAK